MDTSILITGGAGFIGLELVRLIIDLHQHRVAPPPLATSKLSSSASASGTANAFNSPVRAEVPHVNCASADAGPSMNLVIVDSMCELPYGALDKRAHFADIMRHYDEFNAASSLLVGSPPRIQIVFEELDCNDIHALKDVIIKHRVDRVVHLAGFGNIPMAEAAENRDLATKSNTLSLESCCAALDLAGVNVSHFVFGSSSTVYGDNAIGASGWTENLPMRPTCHYGKAKANAEKFLSRWSSNHPQTSVQVLRFFSVYGPWGRPDMAPMKFMRQIYFGDSITLVDTEINRDFTHVMDVGRAILSAAGIHPISVQLPTGQQPSFFSNPGFNVFNIGSSDPHGLKSLIATISNGMHGKPYQIQSKPPLLTDVKTTFANRSKAREMLNWTPLVMFHDGVAGMARWWLRLMANVQALPHPAADLALTDFRVAKIHVVALVATKNRVSLLRERCIASIRNQSMLPDMVVVVHDDEGVDLQAMRALAVRDGHMLPEVHLRNHRSSGASGAWNTGMDVLRVC